MTPQTGVAPEPFDDYGIGDLVTVNLGTVFGPEVVSGVQRVYGFDCRPGRRRRGKGVRADRVAQGE